MRRDLAGYARSGAWSVVAQASQMLGVIALSIIVVRSVSPDAYGVLSIARQITALVVLVSGLALERAALRFIPELVHDAGPPAAIRFFWKTTWVRVVAWIPMLGVVFLLGDWLDTIYRQSLSDVAVVGAATGVVISFHNHVRSCATARFATRTVAFASALGSALTLGATILLLWAGRGIVGVLIGSAIGLAAAAVVMLPPVLARSPRGALERTDEGTPATGPGIALGSRRLLAYVLPFGGITLLNYVVHSQTEVFFLGHYHDVEMAGQFQLGFLFAQRLVDFLPLALWEVSMAGFSRIAVRDPGKLPEALSSYLVLLYLVIAPVACLGMAFAGSVIRLLYTDAYLQAALVSRAYFVMAAVAAFGAPVGMIVYARERVGAALRAYLVFGFVNVGLDLLLIPPLGLWGAILALGIAKLLAVVLMSRLAWQEMQGLVVPWRFIGRAFLASAPVLLWILVEDRWTGAGQIVLGVLAAAALLVVSFRGLRVIGDGERRLIADTRLPLRNELLLLLARGSGARA